MWTYDSFTLLEFLSSEGMFVSVHVLWKRGGKEGEKNWFSIQSAEF